MGTGAACDSADRPTHNSGRGYGGREGRHPRQSAGCADPILVSLWLKPDTQCITYL